MHSTSATLHPLRSPRRRGRLIAARYASGAVVNTLYHSTDVEGLRQLCPTDQRLVGFSADARAVVSEPLTALPGLSGLWHEVPARSAIVVESGHVEQHPFRPRRP
jgi:predicted glutamine amidotransferase